MRLPDDCKNAQSSDDGPLPALQGSLPSHDLLTASAIPKNGALTLYEGSIPS
jgi:hypothetical protein